MSLHPSSSRPSTYALEELRLIKYSLLPDEALTLSESSSAWEPLVNADASDATFDESSNTILDFEHLPPAQFQIKVANAKVWFEIELPKAYPDRSLEVSVKGENITRRDQERWQTFVKAKLYELAGTEYLAYNLISLHLLPELHGEVDELAHHDPGSREESTGSAPSDDVPYHALLTSHHLISPTKRRNLQHWSSSLSVSGFAKVGYPGCIYAQGLKDDVEEFVGNVKAMQWLALKVRFVEPLPLSSLASGGRRLGEGRAKWVEFEKVGEVVEEMKRIGREEFIVQMGIGSLGTSK